MAVTTPKAPLVQPIHVAYKSDMTADRVDALCATVMEGEGHISMPTEMPLGPEVNRGRLS
jgi:hypothetical protein